MPIRRFVRASLSLLVAYALVLGGALGPAYPHGFDPSQHLCSVAQELAGSEAPGQSKNDQRHDCCFAFASAPVIAPPYTSIARTLAYYPVLHISLAQVLSSFTSAGLSLARAPPSA